MNDHEEVIWSEVNWSDPPAVEVTDLANEVVGELLGPKGEVASRIYERPVTPVGFHPHKRSSRVVRFYA